MQKQRLDLVSAHQKKTTISLLFSNYQQVLTLILNTLPCELYGATPIVKILRQNIGRVAVIAPRQNDHKNSLPSTILNFTDSIYYICFIQQNYFVNITPNSMQYTEQLPVTPKSSPTLIIKKHKTKEFRPLPQKTLGENRLHVHAYRWIRAMLSTSLRIPVIAQNLKF